MFVEKLQGQLSQVLKKLQIDILPEEIPLEHPAEMSHGDYSTNVALVATKQQRNLCRSGALELCRFESPRDLAQKIVAQWQEMGLPDFVEKVEVAGPGFINIWLKSEVLSRELVKVLRKSEGYGGFAGKKGKTVVIDYSSPNIAKPFGIGHLRSTNIGQALYNIYHFLGWQTIGDNHLGDWGTQFGKLIYQINLKTKTSPLKSSNILCQPLIQQMTIEDLERLYVEFHKEAGTHPEMEDEARKWFKRLEEGDPQAREIWQACVDISLQEFERIYKLLGVKIDYAYGESFYQDKMEEVLADCRQKGILKESQGALVIEIPKEEVPAMLVKSDGATTYFLRDLATIKFRNKTWQPDLFIYEVGADQTLHFRQLFRVAEILGYGALDHFIHVPHGLIRWASGKFSTREGKTIHLEEVLEEAIERAKKLCETAGVAKDLSLEEKEKVTKAVGIGAVKYNDLKQNPRTDVIFDWDQVLTLSGNSGPYLQYTFARTQSVLGKVQRFRGSEVQNKFVPLHLWTFAPEEIIILRTIYKFPEVVVEAAQTFSPNLLCNFLFDLAQKFNLFYDKHRILTQNARLQTTCNVGQAKRNPSTSLRTRTQNDNAKLAKDDLCDPTEEQSRFRLLLTAAVGQVLKNGLTLLGIEALEKM